ncbi:MAG TPA: hypothetical protein VK917_08340 [Ilumatobacter sp.]|nr:hypothetical protein [Ilumatobacter sp.]
MFALGVVRPGGRGSTGVEATGVVIPVTALDNSLHRDLTCNVSG